MESHMDKKVSNFSIQVDNFFFVSRFSLSEVENQILFSVTIDTVYRSVRCRHVIQSHL